MQRKVKVMKILLILTVLFIWVHSLIPASVSGNESQWWSRTFNSWFTAWHLPFKFSGDKILRKIAHAMEYALLGVIATFYYYAAGKMQKSCGRHHLLYIGFTVAFLDETIQLFTPGRSGEIRDVWIDLSGFIAAMLIVMLCMRKKSSGTDLSSQ